MAEARQADYRSPEFYDILTTINSALAAHKLKEISADDGVIKKSIYNVGKYGNKYMWRVTSYKCPQLVTDNFMDNLYRFLKHVYPEYIADKIITCGNPKYTKNQATGEPIATIVIMLTELPDNLITRNDLIAFDNGSAAAIEKCFEIESRMFKRADDKRDAMTRVEDYSFSLVYEPKLEAAKLKGISNLKLQHQTEVVTLEADYDTDFTGSINNQPVNIEGKSTKADLSWYAEDELCRERFAKYFKGRLEAGTFGSIHNADYVLLVLKQTGDVICVNAKNLQDSWLAGKISF